MRTFKYKMTSKDEIAVGNQRSKDLWENLILDNTVAFKEFGADDTHLLFVGGELTGKTTLQSSFFGKNVHSIFPLSYHSCNIKITDREMLIHVWELSGGVQLEPMLSGVVSKANQSGFIIFVCFNLSKPSSILEGMEWLELMKSRFKDSHRAIFLTGTYYDVFEQQSSSDKQVIVNGLRSVAHQKNTGIIFTSNKNQLLVNRLKNVVKYIGLMNTQLKEHFVGHSSPVLVGPGSDEALESANEDYVIFINKMNEDASNEKKENKENQSKNPINDPNLAEEEIDSLYLAKRLELAKMYR